MRTFLIRTTRVTRDSRPKGFALIVTLSLMILLTIIAVGLLTLSSVSLRISSQGSAMATAQANARLALMLAIGDLQKNAGPDRRITARADVLGANIANPRFTGVWKSTELVVGTLPTKSDYEKSARDAKFLGWLSSSLDNKASQIEFAKQKTLTTNDGAVALWDKGSLGTDVKDPDIVLATKIPTTSPSRGAVAWAVMDEGVKVRINTPYVDDATTKDMQTAQLGSGERPNTSSITGLEKLDRAMFKHDSAGMTTINKGITSLNMELAAETLAPGTKARLKPLTHDVTSTSAGIFTDTAIGGLKEDFNLLTNSSALPATYAAKGVYQTQLGITHASDPRWDSFQQLARIYQDTSRITSSGGLPVLNAMAASGWTAATTTGTTTTTTTINPIPPPGLVLMPTMAKVQVMFSLVGRDIYKNLPPIEKVIGPLTPAQKDVDKDNNGEYDAEPTPRLHGPQDLHFAHTKYDYDLHLMYTPVVTLHNPYNVALEFSSLRVEFLHVPFAMKIYRNGVAQSTDFVPLETMYGGNPNNWDGSQDKIFGMNLRTKTSSGTAGSTTFKMLPGEVKMFSPYIDPNRTYAEDLKNRQFWDIYVNTGLTTNIDAIPGWPGDGIGFDCDNVAGGYRIDGTAANGRWSACLGMAFDDQFHVEFIPKNIPRANSKFVVKMSATPTASNTAPAVSAIEIDYENENGLKDFFERTGLKMPLRYPKNAGETVSGLDLVDRATTSINKLMRVKPFALLSVQAKTTSGGRDTSPEDGRLATKPWCFAHANIGASTQKVLSEHPANFSHEIDLQVLNGTSANLLQVDKKDRANFVSGHASVYGSKFGLQYDIPLAPLQSLVSLNSANPGGSTVYLPRVAHPIGNSWAHPLIDPSTVITKGSSYDYPDHSFLLNLALYDRFYFSGLGDQTGEFGTGKTSASLANEFIAGTPLVDPRLTLYNPDGKASSSLASDITSTDSYTKIAAWQMMKGAFNINSTSVSAWKAMLGSIHDSQAIYNSIDKTTGISTLVNLPAADSSKNETRISRFRLPASQSERDGADPVDAYWLGTREYSDTELQTLAEKIVEQVRLRGPFLSMSEFVNRSLGSGDESQRGALQQAIDNANLNQNLATNANAGFDIPNATVGSYLYKNTTAGTGSSFQGAPGYLTQADLLSVLGNAATPRSDTFTIRGYGEARDPSNKIIAIATCEAVVQRVPDFIDPTDKAETATAAITSKANQTFGRRFHIVSFRWLASNEI